MIAVGVEPGRAGGNPGHPHTVLMKVGRTVWGRLGEHEPCTRVHFALDAAAARTARRLLRADLVEAGVRPELVDTAVLVLSELAGMAIAHQRSLGCGHFELAWCLDSDVLRLSMHDDRSERRAGIDLNPETAWSLAAARGTAGRVLLVQAVCANWAESVEATGLRLTAELTY